MKVHELKKIFDQLDDDAPVFISNSSFGVSDIQKVSDSKVALNTASQTSSGSGRHTEIYGEEEDNIFSGHTTVDGYVIK